MTLRATLPTRQSLPGRRRSHHNDLIGHYTTPNRNIQPLHTQPSSLPSTNPKAPCYEEIMLVWVGRFERHRPRPQAFGRTQTPSDHDYAELILGLTCEPENINDKAVAIKDEISEDLRSVVSSREEYQTAIREGTV